MSVKRVTSRICPSCDRKWSWEMHGEHDGIDECPKCEPRDFPAEKVFKNRKKRLEID